MKDRTVYLGLGGNLGDPVDTFEKVIDRLSKYHEFRGLRCSPFYQTSPVSDIPQGDYLNAVCTFSTCLELEELEEIIHSIEVEFGKLPKEKNAPRIIDIDILFFGSQKISTHTVEVPHPRWEERLFVLKPLSDLTDTIHLDREDGTTEVLDIQWLINNFNNRHNEIVTQMEKV